MTITQIANKLARYIAEGLHKEAHDELYDANIISIEPDGVPNQISKGLAAISLKAKEWENMVQTVHAIHVSEPEVAGNFFTMAIKTNLTFHGKEEPQDVQEIAVFEVKNEKIVKEQFFFDPQTMGM